MNRRKVTEIALFFIYERVKFARSLHNKQIRSDTIRKIVDI